MRTFHRLMIVGFLALGALVPGAAQAQYWDKPGYDYRYAPPPPVYYAPPRPIFVPPPVIFVPPPPRFYAPPVYYGPPRHHYGRPWRGPHRHW
jgi:hypothetical protein